MIEAKIFLLLDYTGSPMKNYVFNFTQTLILFKKPFLLFSKMKTSWSSNLWVEFYYFLFNFFLKICKCVLLNDIDKSVCGEIFIVLQLEDIKENWKFWFLLASRNQTFRFCIITAEQNKTKIFFAHNFADIANITKRINVQNFRGKW